MKRLFLTTVLLLTSSLSQAELSCPELTDVANTLDAYSDAVYFDERIRAGSSWDDELGDVVAVLGLIADEEQDFSFDSRLGLLQDSWVNEDWSTFEQTLLSIADRLDYFLARDC